MRATVFHSRAAPLPRVAPARRGSSLIQMVVVITISSTLLVTVAGAIHILLRTEGQETQHLRVSMTRSRLAAAFREDVHSAGSAEIADNGNTLLLKQGEKQIAWRIEPRQLVRLVTAPAVARETYPLDSTTVRFVRSAEPPRIVELHLDPGGKSRTDAAFPLTIAAVEGRDAPATPLEKTP